MDIGDLIVGTLALFLIMDRGVTQTAVATSLADLQAFSTCLTVDAESFIYLLFDVQLAFDDAKSFCASLVNLDDPSLNTGLSNPSFFLARVSNVAERAQLLNLLNDQVPNLNDRNEFWIGLEDENDFGGTDPSVRFLRWVDGTTEGLDETFIGVTGGSFPWDQGQPNDFNANQNCVKWVGNTSLLDDRNCALSGAVLCRVECNPEAFQPLTAPTQSPAVGTAAPTSSRNLNNTQIIAGASVLSTVAVLLSIGIIYAIRRMYKEKQVSGVNAIAFPAGIDYIDIPRVNNNRSSQSSSRGPRESYSTAFPTSSKGPRESYSTTVPNSSKGPRESYSMAFPTSSLVQTPTNNEDIPSF